MQRLLLVRHCESAGMQPESPLTARGLAQARVLADRVAPRRPDLIVSSPLLRARQTVEPLAAACGLAIEVDERLAERPLAGEPPEEFRIAVQRSFEDFDRRLPGGETSRAAQVRGRQAIEALVRRAHRFPIIATHGQLLALILNSIDPSFGFDDWESLSHPDVFLLEVDGPRWSFRRVGSGAGRGRREHGADAAAPSRFLRNEQYGDSRNLDARIALHGRFSTNPQSWFHWVFDRLPRRERARVLEIGCGPGRLWSQNRTRVPAGWAVYLSDFSHGMLAEARRSTDGSARGYLVADALALPFAAGEFDCVIANHMLYHVPDRRRALDGIARRLTADGCLVAATVGEGHLAELDALLSEHGAADVALGNTMVASFTLENGGAQLAEVFGEVALERYTDGLRVTEVEPVIAYVRSMPAGQRLAPAVLDGIRDSVAQRIADHGAFEIRKDTGVFVARGIAAVAR